MTESKKRRKIADDLDVIDSGESDEEPYGLPGSDSEAEMAAEETAGEKRQRIAKALVDKYRELERKKEEDEEEEEVEEGIHRESEKEGLRDSLVAKILQQEQLEESGRVRRAMASRYSFY